MARIDGLEEKVDQNTASLVENGKAIARLEVRVTRVEDDVTWLRNNHRGGSLKRGNMESKISLIALAGYATETARGQLSIIDVFDYIHAETLPKTRRVMYLACLANFSLEQITRHTGMVTIQIRDPDGDLVHEEERNLNLMMPEKPPVEVEFFGVTFIHQLNDIVFRKYGHHTASLSALGCNGAVSFRVVPSQQK